jgi:hypothetical protein
VSFFLCTDKVRSKNLDSWDWDRDQRCFDAIDNAGLLDVVQYLFNLMMHDKIR